MNVLGIYSIQIDTTDLANGASIAAYLTSASGALITSTAVLGNESLRVVQASQFAEDSVHTSGDLGLQVLGVRRDADTSPVSADGDYHHMVFDENGRLKVSASVEVDSDYVYNEDQASAGGELGAYVLAIRQDTLASSTSADGDFASFKVNAPGELYVVDATVRAILTALSKSEDDAHVSGDQGLQALAVRQDTLAVSTSADGDYSSLKTNNVGALYITGAVTVGGAFAEDAVHTSGDIGLHTLAVRKDALSTNVSADGDYASSIQWSEGSLKVVDIPNIGISSTPVTVTNVAATLGAAVANRRSVLLQNRGTASIFVGPTGVTAATGFEVPRGASWESQLGPAITLFAVTAAGTADVRFVQLS